LPKTVNNKKIYIPENDMNLNQSEKLIEEIRLWYFEEIQRAAAVQGGMENLAESLGYNRLYLYKLLNRNSFSALRRIVKKIQERHIKMKHHKGDYMKCEHYKERKGFDNPRELLPICMSSGKCEDDIPAPGWRDVREELPEEDGLYQVYFLEHNDHYHDQEIMYYYADSKNWHQKGMVAPTHWQLLPAPPEGVRR